MSEAATSEELPVLKSVMSDRITRMRLAVGLLQGVLLYLLYCSARTIFAGTARTAVWLDHGWCNRCSLFVGVRLLCVRIFLGCSRQRRMAKPDCADQYHHRIRRFGDIARAVHPAGRSGTALGSQSNRTTGVR
jgi:hypothetical protein